MRCEEPKAFGLTPDQMMRLADGKPYIIQDELTTSYVLDFTRPEGRKRLSASVPATTFGATSPIW